MDMNRTTLSAALLACCLYASSAAQASQNLISNGELERAPTSAAPAAQEMPTGWEPFIVGPAAKIQIDPSDPHAGKSAARIDADEITRAYIRCKTPIEVVPGETIDAAAWVKVRDVPADKGAVIMIAEFADSKGTTLSFEKFTTLNLKTAGDGWSRIKGSVKIPEEAARLHLRLGFSYSKGSVWWDDISVTAKQGLACRIDLPDNRLSPALKKLPVTLLNRDASTKPLHVQVTIGKQTFAAKHTPNGEIVQRLGIPIGILKPGDTTVVASLLESKTAPKPIFTDEVKATIPPPLTLGIPSPTHWVFDDTNPIIEGLVDVAVPDEIRDGATLSVRVLDSNGTLRGQWQPGGGGPQDGRREFSFKTAVVPEGDYKLVATLTPPRGLPVITSEQPWHVIPGSQAHVTINGRGYPEYNGKPIFPLGIFNGGKFKEQAAAGFTVTHAYNAVRIESDDLIAADKRAMGFLDSTQQNNMKALCMIPMKLAIAGDFDGVRRRVRMFRNHPALLAWDEEEGFARGDFKPDTLKKIREIVQQEDPNHPFMVGDSHDAITRIPPDRSNFFPLEQMDLGMWWWYPFPLKQREADALLGEDAGPANADLTLVPPAFLVNAKTRKPLWIGIQSYKKPGEGSRYPTPAEYRAQAYMALCHGAKGLMWYGGSVHGGIFLAPEEGHWPELKKIVREIRDQQDMFMAPNDTPPALEPSDAPVSVMAKKLGRKKVVIAVNRSAHPVEVTLGGEALPLEPFGVYIAKE